MNNAYIRAQQLKVKEAKFPFVKIGTQYWTTKNLSLAVTPQGNTIPEVQAGGNVEKVVNGGFDTDSVWFKGVGWSIANGIASFNGSVNIGINTPNNTVTIGKLYKVTYTILNYSSGSVAIRVSSDATYTSRSANGTYVEYIKIGSGNITGSIGIMSTSVSVSVLSIDNVSIQEIGWSGSQELYDGIYAQTSGTVEQKTYAAVKAAAMWSNYNNDVAIGAVYGKLYNWFAVKLFQMDIDYYNAANPTKPYIWRVPMQTDFVTLSTYLGGDAVSGGHLKEAGYAHWNSPNIGADNSSGFSVLPNGRRLDTGVFDKLNLNAGIWTSTQVNNTAAYLWYFVTENIVSAYGVGLNSTGRSIRLIKA